MKKEKAGRSSKEKLIRACRAAKVILDILVGMAAILVIARSFAELADDSNRNFAQTLKVFFIITDVVFSVKLIDRLKDFFAQLSLNAKQDSGIFTGLAVPIKAAARMLVWISVLLPVLNAGVSAVDLAERGASVFADYTETLISALPEPGGLLIAIALFFLAKMFDYGGALQRVDADTL